MRGHPSHLGLGVLAFAAAAGMTSPGYAQGAPSHIDAWASLGASSAGAGQVTTAYEPELAYSSSERGAAGQTVTIGSGARVASELGVGVFLTERFGVEAWFARDTPGPRGASGTYDTSFRYVSRPPPDYRPVTVDYMRSDDWGAVSTDVRRWTTAVNAVLRWGARRRVGGTMSGGLALVRTTGEFTPLGYTTFVLGGHSTLFSNEYRLTAEMEPTTAPRANVGGTIDVRLTGHLSLSFALRGVIGADTTSTLRITAVDRSSAGFDPPPNDDVTARLAASSVTLPTMSTRAAAGIRMRF